MTVLFDGLDMVTQLRHNIRTQLGVNADDTIDPAIELILVELAQLLPRPLPALQMWHVWSEVDSYFSTLIQACSSDEARMIGWDLFCDMRANGEWANYHDDQNGLIVRSKGDIVQAYDENCLNIV